MAFDEPDELVQVLQDSRNRFVSGFAGRCLEIQANLESPDPSGDARTLVHRLVGLAGTVGFPAVSERAGVLEQHLQETATPEADTALSMLASIREAFEIELASPPDWQGETPRPMAPTVSLAGPAILLVEDDADQRHVIAAALGQAGFRVTDLASAETLLETATAVRPRVVVLDVMLPGIDGLLACRLLKSDPELTEIPVVFISSRSALDERLSAVALGAADYLTKPLDLNELVFRLKRLTKPVTASPAAAPAPSPVNPTGLMSHPDFVRDATQLLQTTAAALALIRVDPASRSRLVAALLEESRRRDLVADYDRRHVVALYPGLTPTVVAGRLRPQLDVLHAESVDVRAGCAGAEVPGSTSLDDLLSRADEALSEARFKGLVVALHGDMATENPKTAATGATHRILLADDDPDVMRIVDAQMRAQHFQTVLAFDGEAAMAALATQHCDLAVLDLMLPKLTGFEVLQRLHELPHPPRVVVLSARGREEDITRAFQLGADDYVTKPFRPQELAARVVRLLR